MWPFRRREEPAPQPVNYDGMAALGEAFAKSFAAQIEGNAKIAGVFSQFVQQVGEMSIKQAARAMGQRSAAKRERTGKGQFVKKRKGQGVADCALCDEPTTQNVSVEMIKEHRKHSGGSLPPPIEKAPDDAPDAPTELGN